MGAGSSQSFFEIEKPKWHEVPNTKTAKHGPIHFADDKHLLEPHMTLYTNLMERRKYDDGSRRIFGSRKIDETTGKAGDYEWVTYAEFLEQIEALSAGMVHELGLKRQEPVGLISTNRYEWVLVEHSSNRMAYQLVPLYDTLGPSAIPFIVNQTELRVVFCARAQFKVLMEAIVHCPSVKIVVQFEDIDDVQRDEANNNGIELKSLGELIDVGKKKSVDADPPTPDDIATICYTSGSTGDPKGALLSHRNMMSSVMATQIHNLGYASDIHLSYLPLAHSLERAFQIGIIRVGGSIGFYQGNVSKLIDDLGALQPTIFPSVPRVLNRIHDKILQGVEKTGGIQKLIFDMAYNSKKHYLAAGYMKHAFWDALVFSKFQMLMGGKVRRMMNASAPISRECKEFLQIVFGCAVLEGYGLTETCTAIAVSTPGFAPGDHVGVPVPGFEVCLFNVPEMDYTSDDNPDPRGEICVRGPSVFKGYVKDPEKTAEAIDADGWLHTGDIGKWNPDGTLAVIDRKKNIFKLSQGEYIAPEKIENIYIKSPLVAQVFVHGHSLENYLVGVVVPDKEAVGEWAEKNGYTAEDQCATDALKEAIMKDLEALAKKHNLFRFERVAKIHLDDELWTVDNNKITPTFKLKRPQLVKYYAGEIDAMYKASTY